MSLPEFLTSLLGEGRVRVDPAFDSSGRLLTIPSAELDAAFEILCRFESEFRQELPAQPPAVIRSAAMWGLTSVQRACSMLTYRDFDAEQVVAALNDPCPENDSPATAYSVDLTFRFLPDLVRLARAASPEDPLVHALQRWAQQWPLSSVGMSGIVVEHAPGWLTDPCLRQLYVDRILLEQDESRLADPGTREVIRESIGRHSELSPKLADLLAAK